MVRFIAYNPNPEVPLESVEDLPTFERIPGFNQESMYTVESEYHKACSVYPFCILLQREREAEDCIKSIYKLIRETEKIDFQCFYMMPAVGLVCEDRSSCFDLFYWPLSSMLYAVDIADQSYVYGLYMRVT